MAGRHINPRLLPQQSLGNRLRKIAKPAPQPQPQPLAAPEPAAPEAESNEGSGSGETGNTTTRKRKRTESAKCDKDKQHSKKAEKSKPKTKKSSAKKPKPDEKHKPDDKDIVIECAPGKPKKFGVVPEATKDGHFDPNQSFFAWPLHGKIKDGNQQVFAIQACFLDARFAVLFCSRR